MFGHNIYKTDVIECFSDFGHTLCKISDNPGLRDSWICVWFLANWRYYRVLLRSLKIEAIVYVMQVTFCRLITRPVTSLGHQEGRRVFRKGPKFFEICPIFLK